MAPLLSYVIYVVMQVFIFFIQGPIGSPGIRGNEGAPGPKVVHLRQIIIKVIHYF